MNAHYAAIQLMNAKNNLKARFHEFGFALSDGTDLAAARSNVLAAMNVALDACTEYHRVTGQAPT